MRREYYSRDVTRFSRQIMENIRRIDDEAHGLSLLGGWAVYELVDPTYAMESQDIDVVVHNRDAWEKLEVWLRSVGYDWRWTSRKERDNAFIHEYHQDMRVDLFFGKDIPDEIPQKLFNTRWIATIKEIPYEGFVPSVGTVLRDKFETIPKRDLDAKALKDALDAANLLFRNRQDLSPKDLMRPNTRSAARGALPRIQQLREAHAERYGTELGDLVDLIQRTS